LLLQSPESKPTATSAEIKLPETVEITGEQFAALKMSGLTARVTASEVETLEARIQTALLQLENAQRQLKELRQRARDEQAKHQTKLSELTKIPSDRLAEYEPTESADKLTLKRKRK
jgi:hypothetical protein